MSQIKVGFIGAGNMGSALAAGASKAEGVSVYVSDIDNDKALALAEKVGGRAVDNGFIAGQCDYIFLGVKPQVMGDMVSGIAAILRERKTAFTVVTMAAGLKIQRITDFIGTHVPVIRIMPNTPACVGMGMILYSPGAGVSEACEKEFCEILSHAGKLEHLEEELIDAGCAVSGCGPAFVYMFIDAMAKGGESAGLSREQALKLAAVTAAGAAEMILETSESPEKLRNDVCSPGGSTIEGVKVLLEKKLEDTVSDAVKVSFKRTVELGK